MRKIRNTFLHGIGFLLILLLLTILPLGKSSLAAEAARELPDGSYRISVELSGGSGRASVGSPALLQVEQGSAVVYLEWSSSHYDYMVLDGETFYPVNESGNSVFALPLPDLDEDIYVLADTTAMSTPHEIEYYLHFSSDSIMTEEEWEAAAEQITEEESEEEESQALSLQGLFVSDSLEYDHSMELEYAQQFSVDYYKTGEILLTLHDSDRYLLLPAGAAAPEDLAGDIQLIDLPLKNAYLAASAVMDFFISLDAVDQLKFSSLQEDSWYLEEAKQAMQDGTLLYAGKYSAPDYEQIISGDCGLAIESTMIFHTPEVKERLQQFQIPVLVDYSSYESEPLGRVEWIKLYGILTGKEEEAQSAFEKQKEVFEAAINTSADSKTVAFFYITSSGQVNIRRPSDYLVKMLKLAGGDYVFDSLETEESSNSSTMTLQIEQFYAMAKDADYFIYNSTIAGELLSVQDLTAKYPLLSKCKAVENQQVYCTTQNIYQSSMSLGHIMTDFYRLFHGEEDTLQYLFALN